MILLPMLEIFNPLREPHFKHLDPFIDERLMLENPIDAREGAAQLIFCAVTAEKSTQIEGKDEIKRPHLRGILHVRYEEYKADRNRIANSCG